jgi:3-oxoadipate enol-lactonase
MKIFWRVLIFLALWRMFGPVIPPRWRVGQVHPWKVPARTVFAGDREMSVREVGPVDAPVIVLIHGLAGSSMAEWYKVAPLLADRFRVVMIDHRSHGLSVPERGRFEIEDDADDVAVVIGALDLDPAGIAGYSMGGAIAMAVAYRHPHLVKKLALVGAMSHHPAAWKLGRSLGAVMTRGWERLTGTGTPDVRAGYLLAVGAVEPKHARWLWEETHRRDPDAGAAASLALFRFDGRPHLSRITAPTLVVIPTGDQLVPPDWQRELASLIRNSTIEELAGARHELPWTHAEQLAKLLGAFFDEQPAADSHLSEPESQKNGSPRIGSEGIGFKRVRANPSPRTPQTGSLEK